MPSDEDYLAMAAGRNGGLDSSQTNWLLCRNESLESQNASLANTVKAQADEIREMRECLEHYASDKFWSDVFDAYLDRYARQTPDFAAKAQAVLDKWKEGK